MSKGIWKPLGFDIETTAVSPADGVILSVGAYDPETKREFYEEIRWDHLPVRPSAMRINGMDVTTVDSEKNSLGGTRLRNSVCDIAFEKWLKNHGYENRCEYIPVGLNVGSFDVVWQTVHMPKSRSQFGHRFIDLNSLIFRKSDITDYGFKGIRSVVFKEATKRMEDVIAKKTQRAKLNGYENVFSSHNALYDAIHSCHCFNILCETNTLAELFSLSDSLE